MDAHPAPSAGLKLLAPDARVDAAEALRLLLPYADCPLASDSSVREALDALRDPHALYAATQQQQQQQQQAGHDVDTDANLVLLLDVRTVNEMAICRIRPALHLAMRDVSDEQRLVELRDLLHEYARVCAARRRRTPGGDADANAAAPPLDVLFVCRRGNDSQRAAQALQATFTAASSFACEIRIRDLSGGLRAVAALPGVKLPLYYS